MKLSFLSPSTKLKSLLLALFAIVALSSFSFASESGEKTIEKARQAVSKAASGDWKVLTKSAKKCILKNVNLEEAGQWLEKSLSIYLGSYNLEVQGDYYMAINKTKKATESYVKALLVGKQLDVNFKDYDLEQKALNARRLMK